MLLEEGGQPSYFWVSRKRAESPSFLKSLRIFLTGPSTRSKPDSPRRARLFRNREKSPFPETSSLMALFLNPSNSGPEFVQLLIQLLISAVQMIDTGNVG